MKKVRHQTSFLRAEIWSVKSWRRRKMMSISEKEPKKQKENSSAFRRNQRYGGSCSTSK